VADAEALLAMKIPTGQVEGIVWAKSQGARVGHRSKKQQSWKPCSAMADALITHSFLRYQLLFDEGRRRPVILLFRARTC